MKSLRFILNFGWPYLKKYWARFVTGIILGVFFGLFNGSFIWATKTLFSRLEPPSTQIVVKTTSSTWKKMDASARNIMDPWLPLMGRKLDWKQIIGGLLLIPVLIATRGFIGFLSTYCLRWVNERVMNDLRCDVLKKLNTLSIDYFNSARIGDMTTHITNDTAQLHQALYLGLSDLIKEPLTLLSVIGMLLLLDWKLTCLSLVFLPICVVPIIILGKKVRKASIKNVNIAASASSLLIEALSNIRVVKAFGLEDKQNDEFRKHGNQIVHYTMKVTHASELVNPIVETIGSLAVGVIILYVFYTHHSVSNLLALLTGVVIMPSSLKKLANLNMLFQKASASADRLKNLFFEEPSVKEKECPKTLPPFTSEIRFDNISFSYGHHLILNKLSFILQKGKKLGIAGESGSGKSTLINLLFRFYDVTAGSIQIDGHDLRDLSWASLREQMAMVSQEVLLFNCSVADNIALGKLGATREEIENAARAAAAHDFIMNLPRGYDTLIGENGVRLSGGQRQRVSIARAFVRHAPILLLDEATAALDAESESEIQATIDRLASDKTVIVIAHRLATLQSCDHILVLDHGVVAESGTFETLLNRKGAFYEMAKKQGMT